ncbi:alpha/beta hydrolase [Mycobacterium sp. NAZ190054]|uniref:alpha/beta hydrolase n=1 Tax=Mycobacterium sp. NAZ190054 TaxID=1747766 RepID=UPI0012E3A6E1|nr:alpha/beta hydrolase [Mycobacterium sp. NAZ190054]
MHVGLSSLIDPSLWALAAESRSFYAQRPSRRGPSGWDELREVRAAAAASIQSEPSTVSDVAIAGGRSVPIRIHLPTAEPPVGVLLEIHGGGFYMGSAAGSDTANRRLADTLGIAVVSVDYRLAPEHPWPSAPEDCETAALWLVDEAERRFGTTRLAVGGFSAGATLAMVTLLRLRDRGVTGFCSAVLQFGTYDLAAQTPAGRQIADEYFLDAYAGAAPDRTHPHVSPIFADLTGLPPVLIVVGSDDILLEDNLAMAARLSAARVDVNLRIFPDSPHGFTAHPTSMAQEAHRQINAWLTSCLDVPQREQIGPR